MFFSTKKERREELLAEPFPETWLGYLRENVFLYRLFSSEEQSKLQAALRIFIAEKYWEGCGKLEITDEIKVTVAAQACLLVLGFDNYYFDDLRTVLVYPGGYLSADPSEAASHANYLLGEAHPKGPVVISWWHTRWEGRRLGKRNLVLHEFAHKLAQIDDPNSEIPPIANADLRARWEKVMAAEYEQLCDDVDRERSTVIDPYGATNLAEFFAVVTEAFFLQPGALQKRHGQLYGLLAEWFRQDPAARRPLDQADLAHASAAESEYIAHTIEEYSLAFRLRRDAPDAYRGRAALLAEQGDVEKALADYNTVIRLARDDPDAYCDRAELTITQGRLEQALADLDTAIRLDPDFARAYRQRGAVYARLGDLRKAITNFTRAIRADPENMEAYRARAQAHAALGDDEDAERDRASVKKLKAAARKKQK